jgi:toxin ParE1/3/4
MVEIVWTEPAQVALDIIADYIALDNPVAARALVRKVVTAVKQLQRFPKSGSQIPELRRGRARQLIVRPCRIFYRVDEPRLFILYVIRNEQLFRAEFVA